MNPYLDDLLRHTKKYTAVDGSYTMPFNAVNAAEDELLQLGGYVRTEKPPASVFRDQYDLVLGSKIYRTGIMELGVAEYSDPNRNLGSLVMIYMGNGKKIPHEEDNLLSSAHTLAMLHENGVISAAFPVGAESYAARSWRPTGKDEAYAKFRYPVFSTHISLVIVDAFSGRDKYYAQTITSVPAMVMLLSSLYLRKQGA